MEHLKTSGKKLLLWNFLVFALASCAVLNVEVDVYKGPLANHRDIQLEQVAAMAVAARPLLLDLSYQLESKWRSENCGRVRYTVGSGKSKKEHYRKSYSDKREMNDGTLRLLCEQKPYFHHDANANQLFQYQFADPGVSHAFLNKSTALAFDPTRYIYGSSEARKVNALLELYHDQLPSESVLAQVMNRAALIDKQLANYISSEPNQYWEDLLGKKNLLFHHKKVFKDEVYEFLKTCPEPWRKPIVETGSKQESPENKDYDVYEQELAGLDVNPVQAYKAYKPEQLVCGLNDYFNPAKDSGWRIGRRFQRLLYKTSNTKGSETGTSGLSIPIKDAEYFLSTNGVYLWLSKKSNAELLLDSILSDECKKPRDCGSDKLVEHINTTARSFIDSRISLTQLNRFLLMTIRNYASQDESDNELVETLVLLVLKVLDYSDFLLAFNAIDQTDLPKTPSSLSAEYLSQVENNKAFLLIKKLKEGERYAKCQYDIPFVYSEWRSNDTRKDGEVEISSKKKSEVFCGTDDNQRKIKQLLNLSLSKYPKETSEFLLGIDEFLVSSKVGQNQCYFMRGENCTKAKKEDLFQKGPYEHLMGVVVGPNELLKTINSDESFAKIAKDKLSTFSLGLKEGRRDRGLTDQIEKFLDKRDEIVLSSNSREGELYSEYPEEYKKTKALLLNSLEEFAQKLLVIANNNQLFSLDQLGEEQSTSFQVVLQTVGNSILNYSNDITHHDAHEVRLAKRYNLEKNALLHSVALTQKRLKENYHAFLKEKRDLEIENIESQVGGDASVQDKKNKEDTIKNNFLALTRIDVNLESNTNSPLAFFEENVRNTYSTIEDDELKSKGLALLEKFMITQFELSLVSNLSLSDESRDPKAVIDTLILTLQYQYLMANLSGNEERINLLEETIKEAYEHRAGMIYIRPASAYLRSSYAASTLQPDGGSFDTNLLTDKWYKSLPFFGGILNGSINRSEMRFNKVRNDLDKQNWQTVNKILVKGSGKTNYVVVKDDVGNWYVKNYSDEKDEIIESARNLLLFSTSGLDIEGLPLPSDKKDEKSSEASEESTASVTPKTPTAKAAPASTLERFFSRQQSSYYKTSIDHYNMVNSWYATDIAQIVKLEIKKGCEGYEMDPGDDLEFKWLEENKPQTEYSYNNEVPLTSAQLKKVENIGDDIVDEVRDVVFSMPAELKKALESNKHLCKAREEKEDSVTAQEGDETEDQPTAPNADSLSDTNIQLARAKVYDSSIARINSELVKTFMEKRQAFVEEQKSTNFMMQDMLAE